MEFYKFNGYDKKLWFENELGVIVDISNVCDEKASTYKDLNRTLMQFIVKEIDCILHLFVKNTIYHAFWEDMTKRETSKDVYGNFIQ